MRVKPGCLVRVQAFEGARLIELLDVAICNASGL
jgi:hypothetical protein